MNCTVYKNRVYKNAAVHKQTFSRLKVHGGVSKTTLPTGQYTEGIGTAEAAKLEAARTGWEVRICSYCGPSFSRS